MSNSIQVALKVCPLLGKEKDSSSHWHISGNTISAEGSLTEKYHFDHVFDQDATNQIVFDRMAKHIVHSAVHGFNGTIFAYGQTASGKTYTMMGGENDPGVMVLAAREVFNEINQTTNCQFLLRCGFIEIYNEKIADLLNKSNQDLKIHEGANGYASVNCEEVCITSSEEFLQLLQVGNNTRTVGGTNMNERSSRSHTIFRLIIESRQTDSEDENKVTQSVLNLVDLAGSERADQTGARGARLKEGAHINKSLFFLSKAIKQLSENEDNKHISYRDSKLTRILQPSLGGNAFTSIICTVKPTSVEETQSTLNFAMRAKTIKNRPRLNEIVSDATMTKRLAREIMDLRKQLDEERNKNANNVKVAQIKELLVSKELRFVSSSTAKTRIHEENRRRTWCPETYNMTNMNTSISVPSTNPFKQESANSRLKPPHLYLHLTPFIGIRDDAPEEKLRLSPNTEVLDEKSKPTTYVDANHLSVLPKKAKLSKDDVLSISISPNSKNTSLHVAMLEEELQALQEFTKLEKEIGVQHDELGDVKSELEALREKNTLFAIERVQFIATKHELDLVKEQLDSSEERYIKTTEKHQSELSELKAKLLETENHNKTNLQFEMEYSRKKLETREQELLDVITAKNLQIVELEKQLSPLKAIKVQRNKDDLPCLGEQNRVYKSDESDEKLHGELAALRLKLKNADRNYEELKCDRDEKSQRCETLSQEIEVAQHLLSMLQVKYTGLEENWQKQEATIAGIKEECELLEKKNNELKMAYGSLESSATKCSLDCVRVESENKELQNAIQSLQTRLEGMQEEIQGGLRSKNESIPKENGSSDMSAELQSENDKLRVEMKEAQERYKQLQQEYDQLSTNLMEIVEENDKLIAASITLEANLEKSEKCNAAFETARVSWESERHSLEEKLSELQRKLETNSLPISSNTSGVFMSSNKELTGGKNASEESQKPPVEHVELIELEFEEGKCRTYTAIDSHVRTAAGTSCKLSLRNWESTEDGHKNTVNPIECGVLKAVITSHNTNELDRVSQGERSESVQKMQEMQETIQNLETLVRELQSKNEALLDSSQRSIMDLRDQIQELTRELCEKSMVLDDLAKEKAEITLLNEELLTKIAKNQSDINTTNSSAQSLGNRTVREASNESTDQISSDDALKAIKNELSTKEEECNQLKLELLVKMELSESVFRSHLRTYNDEWEKNHNKYKNTIEKLKQLLRENGIPVPEEEPELEQTDDDGPEKALGDDVVKVKCENEDSYTSFPEGDNISSTPTSSTSLTAITHSEGYAELQRSRMERSRILQKCNDQITKLCDSMEEAKVVNLLLSEILFEKEEALQQKDEQIEILKASMQEADFKVTEPTEEVESDVVATEGNATTPTQRQIHDLVKTIGKRDLEIEQLKLTIETSECQAREVQEKALSLENELEIIKTTQLEQKNQRDALLSRISELMDENKGRTEKLNQIAQEQVELQLRLKELENENQQLQTEVDEFAKMKVLAEADKKELAVVKKDLTDMHNLKVKLEEELHRVKKEQTKSQETIAELNGRIKDLSAANEERISLQENVIVLQSKKLDACKAAREDIQEKSEKLSLRIEAVEQELEKTKVYVIDLERTREDYDRMGQQLEVSNKRRAELEQEVINLNKTLNEVRNDINETRQAERHEMEKLEAQLEHIKAASARTTEELRSQLSAAEAEFNSEKGKLLSENKNLEMKFKQLQSKCTTIEEEKVDQRAKIRKLLEQVHTERETLQKRVEEITADDNKRLASLQLKLENQEKVHKDLHDSLEANEAAFTDMKVMMESTIASLRSENKILMERLDSVSEIIKKRTDAFENDNNSMETSTHSHNLVQPRWSPTKMMKSASVEDKKSAIQKERRIRRLSTHDENRRQSANIVVLIDASTTTEPYLCECNELKRQLQECETQNFINESHVNTLRLELRNHPWKTEKAELVKRILDEREKSSLQIKAFQKEIAEQAAKMKTLAEQAATRVTTTTTEEAPSLSKKIATETQTDMTVDECLQKLQGKYNDLKKICRFRYNRIQQLEKTIEEKGNVRAVLSS